MRISDWSSDVCSSDLYRSFVGEHADTGADIAHRLVERVRPRQRDRRCAILAFVTRLQPRRLAIEQCRGQHLVTVAGEAVRHVADMIGDPENLDRKSTRLNSSH